MFEPRSKLDICLSLTEIIAQLDATMRCLFLELLLFRRNSRRKLLPVTAIHWRVNCESLSASSILLALVFPDHSTKKNPLA